MRNKILLYAFVISFCSATYADWVLVVNDSKGQFLIENIAIKRENTTREYWGLQNLRIPNGGIKSAKALHKVDCISGTTEITYMSGHSELDAGGNRLFEVIPPRLFFTAKEKPELAPATSFVCAR
jgi:hypothetical protein